MEWIINNKKKILFGVMCALLVVVVVMSGILISRIGQLVGAFLGGSDVPAGSTPPGQTDTTPPTTTVPPTTLPPTITPPTTTPPTTRPTEPGHVHEYVMTEQVKATCEHMGYDVMVCSGCGKQDIQNMVDSLGHDYGPGQTIAPTCTEAGCTRSTCNRCGHIREKNQKDPLGHDYKLVESVAASCGVAGYDKKVCGRCQEDVIENEVPALEHQDTVIVDTAATCTADGVKKVQCSLCNRLEETVTPATGHSFGEWVTDKDGTHRTCATCGAVEVKAPAETDPPAPTEPPATTEPVSCDHQLKAWTLTANAASSQCSLCKETLTIPVGDLIITDEKDLSVGDNQTVFIQVGTADHPEIADFGIVHPAALEVAYALDGTKGLVVTYLDGSGETVEAAIPFDAKNKTLVISVG